MSDDYLARIGTTIKEARNRTGISQSDLAAKLETSQGAVARIEAGGQNLTLDSLARISEALDAELVTLSSTSTNGAVHLKVEGGRTLSGAIDVKTSKNAAVALLCASLLNKGTTTLRNLARIEEVNRILEVLESIGVKVTWSPDKSELELIRPDVLDLASMDIDLAMITGAGFQFWNGGITPLLDREGVSERVTGQRFLPKGVASVPA